MHGKETELNVVDQMVKQSLLRCPTMYGSRLAVLSSVFFIGGNGYFWQQDGTLGSRYPVPMVTEMQFSDLDSPAAPVSALETEIDRFLAGHESVEQAKLKRLRAIRSLIAEDIDLYARYNVMGDSLHIETLKSFFGIFELDHGLIAKAPFEVLHPDWAKALIELLNAALQTLRQSLHMSDSSFSREVADPQLLGYYDKIEALIGKVASVPGLYNKGAVEMICERLQASMNRHL